MLRRILALAFVLAALPFLAACGEEETPFDLVIADGRVIDPESGLDAVRHLGIREGRIVAISAAPLRGRETVDAAGLVVAPGFIDIHSHAQTVPSNWLQAFDGVTTALELEAGTLPVAATYDQLAREGRPLNFGFSVNWAIARQAVLSGATPRGTQGYVADFGRPGWQDLAGAEQSAAVLALVEQGLKEGALGIGLLTGYAPASNRTEYFEAGRLAAQYGVPTFTHIRTRSIREPNGAIEGFQEVIAVAAGTGAHMHICHLNSSALREVDRIAGMIAEAQRQGLRITTEGYPWGAGSTTIGAPFLRPENLPNLDIGPSDIEYVATGERPATADRLAEIRAADPGGISIIHYLNEGLAADRDLLARALLVPGGIFASDAVPLTVAGRVLTDEVWPLPADAVAHPRLAGTYTRILGTWVREEGRLDLMEAIRRSSLLPAQLLEEAAPQMKAKGRIAPGADADIVIFDAATVAAMAHYGNPAAPATGMKFVIVNGAFVIRDGALLPDARPGRAVRGPDRG